MTSLQRRPEWTPVEGQPFHVPSIKTHYGGGPQPLHAAAMNTVFQTLSIFLRRRLPIFIATPVSRKARDDNEECHGWDGQ